jgi:hypothetical protein
MFKRFGISLLVAIIGFLCLEVGGRYGLQASSASSPPLRPLLAAP